MINLSHSIFVVICRSTVTAILMHSGIWKCHCTVDLLFILLGFSAFLMLNEQQFYLFGKIQTISCTVILPSCVFKITDNFYEVYNSVNFCGKIKCNTTYPVWGILLFFKEIVLQNRTVATKFSLKQNGLEPGPNVINKIQPTLA